MAAYAALLSVFHTLNNINSHPRPPIRLDQEQVHSLTRNLTFFQHFLESYPSYEDDDLESRMAAAAYAAEDVIETHIVDYIHHARSNITTVDFSQGQWRVMDLNKRKVMKIMGDQPHPGSTSYGVNHRAVDLHQDLERVIRVMNLIKRDVMEIIQEKIMGAQHHDLHTNSSVSTASGWPVSTWQSSAAPVLDDVMINKVLDKLTGHQCSLQIISIVGMGGIGKTTLASNIYKNPLTVQHFDIRAWVTISQEYNRGNILQVLCQEVKGSISGLSEIREDEIGLILYQHLWGRRYLIVLDDIWSVEAWDKIKSFFPDNNDGSRIMITTRMSNLALDLSGSHALQMKFLKEDNSWDLLCQIVFGKLDCPIELENIGKEIARKCRGLPLSIIVIGGLLKKSNMKKAYWMYTLENLNLLINLEKDEYTLRILRTSYKELPMHLKPCFLYIGIFPEDDQIKTSLLIKLWVAEGILKPISGKSLEEVGKEYLKELIDRNLVLISKWHLRWDGKVRFFKIHDLLRDVCLREAQKQKFFCVLKQQKHHTPQEINMERRICINPDYTGEKYSPEFIHAVESASLARSFLYKIHRYATKAEAIPSVHFSLLRVYSPADKFYSNLVTESNNAIFEHANLRYLFLRFSFKDAAPRFHSLCSLLWNLQTLEVEGGYLFASEPITASEIWEMPLLRHVTLDRFALPDPPIGEHRFVLENLQTLSGIRNLKFSEEVVKRIPNIKKLRVSYSRFGLGNEGLPNFCFKNLGRLQKLEYLRLHVTFTRRCDIQNVRRNLVSFPQSLRKLILSGTRLSWKELTKRIGSLPLLQLLTLLESACRGHKWETVEGQFCSLRLLGIARCYSLKYWETDSAHFPCLEVLNLTSLRYLEIPSSIGDIPTLKSIELHYCKRAVADSAKRIKEEQEENGNEDLQVGIFRTIEEDQVVSDTEEEEEEEEEEDQEMSDEDFYSVEEDQVVSDEDFYSVEEDQVVSDEEEVQEISLDDFYSVEEDQAVSGEEEEEEDHKISNEVSYSVEEVQVVSDEEEHYKISYEVFLFS